jgi:hypothetical protein
LLGAALDELPVRRNSIAPTSSVAMSTSSSYILSDMSPPPEDDDIDSLPSDSSGVLSSETDSEYASDAQKEWERSLDQLQLLLTMVLVPFVGKYLGRKFAYWSMLFPNRAAMSSSDR